ncbi:hypothetical protein NE237_019173 [Protea cynaroides]|uniref:DYW domain-containing protein n=1 Tax=Protea cynaroides TaxID=273540 RepID=A0A9Q0KBE0_9MAGN|nr:hypothetical protein NE237_019173 [Protea cynaroides]
MGMEQWTWRLRWRWRLKWANPFCTIPNSSISQPNFVQLQQVGILCARGQLQEALSLFYAMSKPHSQAYATLLQGCARHRCLDQGRALHHHMLAHNYDPDLFVTNHLINMYSKCGCLEVARQLFDQMSHRNLVSWTALITGYDQHDRPDDCFRLFSSMLAHHRPTEFAFASVLGSCDCIRGRQVEVATALVNAYSKLGGDVDECYRLFTETNGFRDVVSWTGIITSCAEQKPEQAILLFRQLQWEGINPDLYTFSAVIKACSGLTTERHGSAMHAQVIKAGFEEDTVLANALIHAYARCGSICRSEQVFKCMEFPDTVSWNSIFKAYALHGKAVEALLLFEQMNVQPDTATFVALLTACSHTGLVDQGTKIFDMMVQKYGICPQLDHFACMVDILGRAGHLLEAEALIRRMPMEPDSVVWSALLGACRKHREPKLAELAGRKLMELDPKNSLGYVLMSNIYSSEGCFDNAALIRKEMKECRVRKEPGLSWIEVGNQVHEFAAGGQRHPQREAICAELDVLVGQLKEIGYVPERNSALHDIGEEHKEDQLLYHSEKLALAFAVMNSGRCCDLKTIRIMKNIRICLDCHNFMKLASDLLQSEILVRDANRFHHFRDGLCSCSDYW